MGVAGAGSLATVINAAIKNRARMDTMKAFFGDTGDGDRAGVWEEKPVERPANTATHDHAGQQFGHETKGDAQLRLRGLSLIVRTALPPRLLQTFFQLGQTPGIGVP